MVDTLGHSDAMVAGHADRGEADRECGYGGWHTHHPYSTPVDPIPIGRHRQLVAASAVSNGGEPTKGVPVRMNGFAYTVLTKNCGSDSWNRVGIAGTITCTTYMPPEAQ